MQANHLCYQFIIPLTYQEFMDGHYLNLKSVRQINSWEIFSGWVGKSPFLFIVEHDIHQVLRCEYESLEKQERDIELWRQLPPGGDEEAGVGAKIGPLPPSFAASSARPFPSDTEAEPPAV